MRKTARQITTNDVLFVTGQNDAERLQMQPGRYDVLAVKALSNNVMEVSLERQGDDDELGYTKRWSDSTMLDLRKKVHLKHKAAQGDKEGRFAGKVFVNELTSGDHFFVDEQLAEEWSVHGGMYTVQDASVVTREGTQMKDLVIAKPGMGHPVEVQCLGNVLVSTKAPRPGSQAADEEVYSVTVLQKDDIFRWRGDVRLAPGEYRVLEAGDIVDDHLTVTVCRVDMRREGMPMSRDMPITFDRNEPVLLLSDPGEAEPVKTSEVLSRWEKALQGHAKSKHLVVPACQVGDCADDADRAGVATYLVPVVDAGDDIEWVIVCDSHFDGHWDDTDDIKGFPQHFYRLNPEQRV
jgi:hypothetical protein